VTLAVFLLGFTPFTRDPWWHQSYLLPGFQGAAGWLAERLPDAVRRYVEPLKPMARDVSFSLPTARAAGLSIPASAASVRRSASIPDSPDPAHQP
jgi:membrane protein required for colicin V production